MLATTRTHRSILSLSALALMGLVSLACGVEPGDAAGAAFKKSQMREAKSTPKLMNTVQAGGAAIVAPDMVVKTEQGAAIVAPDMVEKIVAPDMVVKTEQGAAIVAPDMVEKIVAPDMVQKTENGTTIVTPERLQK